MDLDLETVGAEYIRPFGQVVDWRDDPEALVGVVDDEN